MNADNPHDETLLNFQTAAQSVGWEVVTDDVMGGVSVSEFQMINGSAVFQGTVRLENNGGFASVRFTAVHKNLMGFTAFILRVRGDGHRYKFGVRTTPGFDTPLYQCSFTTKPGGWEEHRLALGDFIPTFRGQVLTDVPPLNPAKVSSVGFLISDNQAGPFRLEIAWIKVLR
jgi:NADH dehydrogenase [ubiquinone] 1 alpha subcomplex assembly factor 1